MKRRIIALILVMGLLAGMGLDGKMTLAAESTPAGQTKEIAKIEVVDTEIELPYKSTFTKENVVIKVTYEDATEQLVHPEKMTAVDTTKIGEQQLELSYQDKTINYTVRIVPRQVTGLRRKETTKKKAVIEWNALAESEEYEIFTSSKETSSFSLLKSTTKTSYEFTNLKEGQILYVKIRAGANGYYGKESEVLLVALQPGEVTKITATKNVKTKITLAWEPVSGATGYQIYYRKSTSKESILAGNTIETTFDVTGLSAGKDYYFTIVAYAGDVDNPGEPSEEVLFGTAPSIPSISKIKGGDKRIKVKWSKGTGADYFNIYYSKKSASGYKAVVKVPADESKIRGIDGLKKNTKYYVKIEAVRTVSGITMSSVSTVKSIKTASKKVKATSISAKFFKTKKAFKKSAAYKKYKAFKKRVSYAKSYVIPGLVGTNVGGFYATRMVPQSVTFAGNYLLISAYDYTKKQESVIYVMNKTTRKYITTIVLPHTGHVGGITFDGENVWVTYGKNLQSFKFNQVQAAVLSGRPYYEIYRFASVVKMPETMSYVTYYNNRIWAAAYSEFSSKYMYGYTIQNKSAAPSLTYTNRILMPNRTQGVAFTTSGKMIVSRSCQTKKGRRGFMSQLETYQPTWDYTKLSIKKNKKKAEALLQERRRNFIPPVTVAEIRLDEDILFADFMLKWLEVTKSTIQLTTYASYQGMVEHIIVPYFRKHSIKLVELKATDLQDFYAKQLERVKPNTVIHYHANIHKALKYAVKIDLIPSNPADKVERPKKDDFKGSYYTAEEIHALTEAAYGTKLEIPVLLASFYGLRRSEVLGLKWDAIDFEANTMEVKRIVTQASIDGKKVLVQADRAKTKSSLRTLPLVPPIRDRLLELKGQQETYRRLCRSSYNPDYLGYLCVDEIGNILRPNYVSEQFPKLLEKNGLRPIRFHDLRHSCASLLLANGVPMKQIQEWLGHSDFSTTANIYAHLDYASKLSSAQAMLECLGYGNASA